MVKKYAALITATFMGVGYFPFAPGTVASAVVTFIWFVTTPSPPWLGMVIALILFYPATLSAGYVDRMWNTHDSGRIVIDEVIGMLIPLSFAHSLKEMLLAFFLFRFFDILKPFPIRRMERKVRGGLGVIIDDVAAGAYATIVLLILSQLSLT